MSKLDEIFPKHRLLLMDLVKAAGVDVGDWANCIGGAAKAARNPKYCYRWSFVQPGKVVVLNLWHDLMKEEDGVVTRKLNMRDFGAQRKGPEKRRAFDFDNAVQIVIKDNIPIRVVVLGGHIRNIGNPNERPSKVTTRMLDPVPWSVTAYDWNTGECILAQGTHRFVDQFTLQQELVQPARRDVSGQVFVRSAVVRSNVLLRASGKCEWCDEAGFVMPDGRIYLETHHVDSLCDGGSDTENNVAALCANHHREAHHGASREAMRKELLARIGPTRR
jgi:5-methylcytosine-specific restriction enzyme A